MSNIYANLSSSHHHHHYHRSSHHHHHRGGTTTSFQPPVVVTTNGSGGGSGSNSAQFNLKYDRPLVTQHAAKLGGDGVSIRRHSSLYQKPYLPRSESILHYDKIRVEPGTFDFDDHFLFKGLHKKIKFFQDKKN